MHLRHRQHVEGRASAFTTKYKINRLVHVETTNDIYAAITREKQLKGWTRAKKIALIETHNPTWEDLAESWREKA